MVQSNQTLSGQLRQRLSHCFTNVEQHICALGCSETHVLWGAIKNKWYRNVDSVSYLGIQEKDLTISHPIQRLLKEF